MARILVVAYSRSGATHRVAQAIAQACDADLERIKDTRSRRGLWGWIRSGREAMRGVPAAIRPQKRDPASYDLVVLGSPVWVGHVSSPMRAYLGERSGAFGRIALFVTEGGSGGTKALAEMSALAGQQPVATLELRANELGDELTASIGDFVERIHEAAASSTPAGLAP
ncbi:MAG TPA: hypothetical protein VLM36_04720 [Sphingomicrobium sp.]|nr:hypothetical protein [Sphingomicrobium sp.]